MIRARNQLSTDEVTQAFGLYGEMIFHLARQRTQNSQDAEDIVQEVFISLLSQRRFASQEHLKAWLIRNCINRCNSLFRSARRRHETELTIDVASFDKHDQLADVLTRLPAADRDLLYLYYYQGYQAKEIAFLLGKKENAIHIRLSRARDKLRALLQEDQ